MTTAAVEAAVRLTRTLPRDDIRQIAEALLIPHGLNKLAAKAVHRVRDACTELKKYDLTEFTRPLVAGVLLGAIAPGPASASITPVWTGPGGETATRLTSAVVVDLISEATEHVLLVGYAVHNEPTVTATMRAAHSRGVAITLVLEREVDNPHFNGGTPPFPGLNATRLFWPAGIRPQGASLHAKVLVIDETAALIGSANITGAALGKNLECGLLIRGGNTPKSLRRHITSLQAAGHLLPGSDHG